MPASLALSVALELIKRFEGFYPEPYLCPAGILTIGYGSTHYEDGRRVTLKDKPITQERAFEMLLWEVEHVCLPAIARLCPGIDSPYRLAAIISWVFNLGSGRLQASTLRRRIAERRWEDVPDEIRKWNKGGGRVLSGLVKRREAEANLIWWGQW